MNCFKHNDRPAVGICKSCGKGVCLECAAQQTNGIACKGNCESRVDLLNKIVDNNAKILTASRYQIKSAGWLSVIFGVVLLAFAAMWSTKAGWKMSATLFACLGVLFLVTGILRLSKKCDFPKTDK